MKLRKEEIQKIATVILSDLRGKSFLELLAPEDTILAHIENVLGRNIDEEAAIEDEVKKIMDQYRAQIASGSMDPQKLYMMIKKQVARERKFIL